MPGKAKDLTGQKFNRWTVLGRQENSKPNRVIYLCRCECGSEKPVRSDALTSGDSQSCGCIPKFIDLTGKKFERLTVIERLENNKHGHITWRCTCECGRSTKVASYSLTTGHIRSCGRCKPKGKFVDMSGKQFGDLQVVCRGENIGSAATWECVCTCGNSVTVKGWNLRTGHTKSCGCKSAVRKIHEMCNESIYVAWENIIQRCTNPKHPSWADYGGRKITLCNAWRADFQTFYNDVGERPTPLHSIDRINNDAGYHCGKCEHCLSNGWIANTRWATRHVQALNKRPRRKKNHSQ